MSKYRYAIVIMIVALALLGCGTLVGGIYLFSQEKVAGGVILSGLGMTILVIAGLAGITNG